MTLDQKYAIICEIVDNLCSNYICYGDDEAHATIQTEYTGNLLKLPLKRDGSTWYIANQLFRNIDTLIEYILLNDLLKSPIKTKYAPNKNVQPPPFQIVSEGYNPYSK